MIFYSIASTGQAVLDIANELNQISNWIKGLGIIAIAWIIYSTIMYFMNRRRIKLLEKMKKDIARLEDKIDKLHSKK